MGWFGRDAAKHTRLADAGIEWLGDYMSDRVPVTRHVNLSARTTRLGLGRVVGERDAVRRAVEQVDVGGKREDQSGHRALDDAVKGSRVNGTYVGHCRRRRSKRCCDCERVAVRGQVVHGSAIDDRRAEGMVYRVSVAVGSGVERVARVGVECICRSLQEHRGDERERALLINVELEHGTGFFHADVNVGGNSRLTRVEHHASSERC